MKLRKKLPYGYKAFNGKILHKSTIDSYNMIQDEINAFIKANRKVPESVLNRSHHVFVIGAGLI